MKFRLAAVLAAVVLLAPAAQAARYEIDAVHSSVGFKVAHMVVSRTSGNFSKFSGEVHFEPGKPESWKTKATIEAASIDTGNEKRDGHLQDATFFDTAKHPTIEFVSTKIKKLKGDKAKLHGKLTIKGVTKDVVLDMIVRGAVLDAEGGEHVGFTATTTIDRMDYGVSWSRALDTGGLMVGKLVEITLEIEAIAMAAGKK